MVEDKVRSLITKSKEGNVDAFELLVKEFQSFAFALAMRLLGDEEDSTDAVQDSFISVWKNIHRFRQDRKFTTWLYTIVTNRCLDRIRVLKRNRSLFSSRTDDAPVLDIPDDRDFVEIQTNRELAEMIRNLAGILPVKQRLVFTLRDMEDLTVDEVAEITGLSVGSVKTNLHFARKRIRKAMAERYHIRRVEL